LTAIVSPSHRPATTALYALSLHDALPISWHNDPVERPPLDLAEFEAVVDRTLEGLPDWVLERIDNLIVVVEEEPAPEDGDLLGRSEEHTSELQSRENLVCRLLLEKKKLTE